MRAAIYTRISEDRFGEAEGVDRQKKACYKLAKQRDLEVADEHYFEDNNRSAMHGKRPKYDQLIAAVKNGEVDVIIVLRTDRLYRRLKELIELTDILRDTPVYSVHSGDVDLSTADGRMMANVLGSMAQHESEVKSERISAAARQRAAKGRFNGGNRRFGYEHASTRKMALHGASEVSEIEVPTGKLVLVPAEAEAIKWAYGHVLNGGSLRSVCREWTGRGLVGSRGAPFSALVIREILRRPMNAGLATYKGQILEAAHEAPAIVGVEDWRRALAILDGPDRRGRVGRPATSLLAPVLQCAVCVEGGHVKSYVSANVARSRGDRPAVGIYKCKAGHVERRRANLDTAVDAMVLAHIIDNADRLQRPTVTNGQIAKQEREMQELRNKLAKFAARAADLDVDEYINAVNPLRARLKKLEKASVLVSGNPATAELLRSDDIAGTWAKMNVETKRTIIQENVSRIQIGRARPGGVNILAGVHIFDRDGKEIEIGTGGWAVDHAGVSEQPTGGTEAWGEAMAERMPPMTDKVAKRVSAAMFPS